MTWLRDTRFWVTVFIVAFWPAVIIGHVAGLVMLLVLVVAGAWGVSRLDRRTL